MCQPDHNVQFNPNDQLGKYLLRNKIGQGTFGEVWHVADLAINQEYALKILRPGDPVALRLREARIGHFLAHDNLVRVHQADLFGQAPNTLVLIAMDYLPDSQIGNLANPKKYFPLPDLVKLGKEILRGLEYLHGVSLIHNDVKPDNVLIGPHGQGMLTDYGIVGIAKGGEYVPAERFYNIHAAPEVVKDNVMTYQTDIFQTGLTLFRMAVGLESLQRKYENLGMEGYREAASNGNLISLQDFPPFIPSRLRRIILKATRPAIEERYESAHKMRSELERLDYRGYWTVDENGDFSGYRGAYRYHYEKIERTQNRYDVIAYKSSRRTGHKTRCIQFCHDNLKNQYAKQAVDRFIKFVVEGG